MAPRPVTLITGASAGLGVEFAKQCAARGGEVVLVARRKDRLNQLAAELGKAHVIAADLAKPKAPAELLKEIRSRDLWVRTLINNAGFGLHGRFDALPLDRQLEMIDLNIRSLTNLAFVVLDDMRANGGGAILNVASTAAFQPGPNMAVYFATKAYVLSFTEALHEEWKDRGIKVSALCPGPTRTEFGDVAGIKTLGSFDRLAMDAGPVVKAGLDGLESNSAVVIPGIANKAGALSAQLAPRSVVRKIAGSLKF
ncbi:SDR family NAD(P)-dependent oxidoreductase [Sphingomonas daechungensis]|uniref:SDR family NAD(P)-dependent oxidoreductase n=1 Tax=Sphingomonas daechungensis TaxID=1176646 RepID=UPI003784D14F